MATKKKQPKRLTISSAHAEELSEILDELINDVPGCVAQHPKDLRQILTDLGMTVKERRAVEAQVFEVVECLQKVKDEPTVTNCMEAVDEAEALSNILNGRFRVLGGKTKYDWVT